MTNTLKAKRLMEIPHIKLSLASRALFGSADSNSLTKTSNRMRSKSVMTEEDACTIINEYKALAEVIERIAG